MIAVAILSVVSLSYAQRASVSIRVGGGGGYYGHGHYGGYNHHGYAAAPYVGVATGPIGYYGPAYGPAYGPRPHGRCAWNHYYHQWNCW